MLAITSIPPTTNNVMVGLACALRRWTSLSCLFTSSFPSLSFSLAFLFDIITLYCKKTLVVAMNTADVIRSGIIKGMYKISQSTNAKGQIISTGTMTMIIMAKMIDNAHIAAMMAVTVLVVMILLCRSGNPMTTIHSAAKVIGDITVIRWSMVTNRRTERRSAIPAKLEFISSRYRIMMRYCRTPWTVMLAISVASKLATKK